MKYIKLIAIVLLAALMCACNGENEERKEYPVGDFEEVQHQDSEESVVCVRLDAKRIETDGEGAAMKGGNLEITKGGIYALSGTLNGSIIVEVSKEEKVELFLDGVTIYSESSAIYVKSADKVVLELAKDSENVFYDGKTYAAANGSEPSACIYSADDLTIRGEGALKINANCKNGIQTKNDLRIKGGIITVFAPKNALKGKDSVQISGGEITVLSSTDAIKSDNEKEEDRGKVIISGGKLNLSCQDDGIQAFRSVEISGCEIEIYAGDKDINCDGKVKIEDGCIKTEE
ncbi:MAG: carbohydrate-binding domain-containing protein [Clostridia bacterium]|nr:carbohydrate-binding domain-containing protein [Clostridia bacterium]